MNESRSRRIHAADKGTRQTRSFPLSLIVASSGATFAARSIWASNVELIASPLRLLQIITIEVASCTFVLGALAKRGRNLVGDGISIAMAGLLFGAGDVLVQRFGSAGAWTVFVTIVIASIFLLRRFARSSPNGLGALAVGFAFFFFLQPSLPLILDRDIGTSRVSAAAPDPVVNSGAAEDFFLIVLDGYASFDTLQIQSSFESPIRAVLVGQGFEVVDSAWSPSTRTIVSIASLVNLGVPLASDEALTAADHAALYAMIRGEARLFSMFKEAGFDLIYVESGWVGSVCGYTTSVCVRRPFVDDAVQAVVDSSLASELAESWWGHSYALGGLHSLDEVEDLTQRLGSNGSSDIVFAHIMLPHSPYVLGSDCKGTGVRVLDPADEQTSQSHAAKAREAYSAQLQCVDQRLTQIVRSVGPKSAVVITGDHGTTFGGQMFREAATWSTEDIIERGQVILATKVPNVCAAGPPPTGSLQAVMNVADCLLATRLDRKGTDAVWLFGLEGMARCVQPPRGEPTTPDVDCI